ncbi:hypothetical protein [Curtobacterium sp. MCJR17_043]|uniref:arsenate reductase/protein-tyrosine-phosphatase family protein n=1 Tax=Curtobacterium sp. MCJR17_043 TaxID=2175660 RepID=UPI0024E0088B|nr:hypothetical protein [Curtobacterium sp. MCJR17_043]WIB36471.1 hypothetical protein DEJ15_04915 [Curtobacterium sp. MCJR17_043]
MRILFVCSGNICRSPLGAQVLQARLGPAASVHVVESAGTIADDGAVMDGAAAAQSVRLGGVTEAHRSRYLTEQIAASADLVLTAERSHRSAVVQLAPRAAKRAFTIKQFARVLDGLEPGGPRRRALAGGPGRTGRAPPRCRPAAVRPGGRRRRRPLPSLGGHARAGRRRDRRRSGHDRRRPPRRLLRPDRPEREYPVAPRCTPIGGWRSPSFRGSRMNIRG